MTTNQAPKLIGTRTVPSAAGEVEVPAYRAAVGQSANDAAKALGLRLIGRREPRESVVAVAIEGGDTYGVKP
jgi:hypothetical protein